MGRRRLSGGTPLAGPRLASLLGVLPRMATGVAGSCAPQVGDPVHAWSMQPVSPSWGGVEGSTLPGVVGSTSPIVSLKREALWAEGW